MFVERLDHAPTDHVGCKSCGDVAPCLIAQGRGPLELIDAPSQGVDHGVVLRIGPFLTLAVHVFVGSDRDRIVREEDAVGSPS